MGEGSEVPPRDSSRGADDDVGSPSRVADATDRTVPQSSDLVWEVGWDPDEESWGPTDEDEGAGRQEAGALAPERVDASLRRAFGGDPEVTGRPQGDLTELVRSAFTSDPTAPSTAGVHDAAAALRDAIAGGPGEQSPQPVGPGRTTLVRGRRRHRTTAIEWVVLAALVTVGAGLAARADARPTGLVEVDAVLDAAVVAAAVLAGSRARRWALVCGAAAVAMVGAGLALAAGAIALAAASVLTLRNERNRTLGGAIGAMVALGALNLPAHRLGAGAWVVAFAALAVVLGSGWANAPASARARVRVLLLAGAAAVAILLVVGIAVTWSARARVARGVRLTQAAVTAAEAGDQRTAVYRLAEAQEAFDAAHARLGARWLAPIQVVPVLSQNFRAVRDATAIGRDVAGTLVAEVGELTYDRLSRPGGGIDVDVLASFGVPVQRVDEGLRGALTRLARLESPWLVGPVDARLAGLRDRLREYRGETSLARLAVDRAPALLGADRPRRYLVLLGNPAEARDLGGHIGTWAEVTADRGRLDLVEVGGPRDLALGQRVAAATLGGVPPSLLDLDPRRFPQNWGADPDLPTVARLVGRLFAERTGRRLDGVAYADPEAFAAIVGLTGPRTVAGTEPPYALDQANAAKFLVADQFIRFPTEQAANDATEALVREVFDDLMDTRLPAPRVLGRRFGPLVHAGRFAFASLHDADRPLLERMGIERRVPDPAGASLIGVENRNANPSKIDTYLRRTAEATLRWDPTTGDVRGEVRVTLRNLAPPGGLSPVVVGNELGAPVGTNVTDLALLTRYELDGVTVDGRPAVAAPTDDGRWFRHTVRVEVAPGGEVVVRFLVHGTVPPGPEHRVVVLGQALVNDPTTTVTVVPVGGHAARGRVGVPPAEGAALPPASATTGYRTFRWNLEGSRH